LSSNDVDFETFGVLRTTLIEICYVKFKMAKPRCRAKAFFYLREETENFMKKMQASVRIASHNRCKTLPLWWIFRSTWI